MHSFFAFVLVYFENLGFANLFLYFFVFCVFFFFTRFLQVVIQLDKNMSASSTLCSVGGQCHPDSNLLVSTS